MSPHPVVAPARRQEIVGATVRILARDGLAGLTMKALAREAKLPHGSLHYYFRDKRAIVEAAVDRVMSTLHHRVAARLADARDPRRRLRAMIEACLGMAEEQRDFWTIFVQFWSAMAHDKELHATNAKLYASLRQLIGRIVRAGIRRGDFRPLVPDHAGAVILALLDGLSLQRSFDPTALSFEDAVRLGQSAVLRFLARPRRRRRRRARRRQAGSLA
jgi:AcrR family transcriptional regulator